MQIRTIKSAGIGWVLIAFSVVICLPAQRAGNAAEPTAQRAAQVERGQSSFLQNCASCHGRNLDNGEFAPAVKGRSFLNHWGARPVSEFAAYLRANMPPGRTGELSKDDYTALVAFIMNANGASSDATSLPTDSAALTAIRLPGEPPNEQAKLRATRLGSLTAEARIPEWPRTPSPLDHYTPVTEPLLDSPPEGEWLTWRRTHDALGYSPLRQINKANVVNLHLVWSLALPVGINEMEPLVHDGVIFVFSFRDNVQALDAETGDELWHYARQLPDTTIPTTKRTMALFGDKLFIGTSDVHEIALDARTGRLIWDQPIGSPEAGFTLSGGPIVAKGKVMQGVGGMGADGGAYIAALDAETGKEAWRFYSIPRPGQPGGDSWNGLPVEKRHGGSVWTSGSYDPELNLAFFGPGNTYDTGPLRYPSGKRGVTNDGLYTETTIALDPDTGKLKWHFQHVRNDQWDLDWAFEREILHLPVNGEMKKLVVTGGKLGIFDALEAANGKYAFSVDMGLQTLISAIDPKTGAKTIDPKLLPDRNHVVTVCPHGGGGRNWMPTSYNPETKVLFVAAQETCMELAPAGTGERGFLSTGVNVTMHPRPDSDGRFGRLQAIDLEHRKTLWEDRQRAFQSGGVLSTGGGVVFAAATDRWFSAYDDANGRILWRARLADIPNAPPITYSVKGKQYVAVVVGYGESAPSVFTVLTPEIPLPIARSSSIWVFALPDGVSSSSTSPH
jgi:alcohol dehydrogenase (cytochrome c)